MDDDALFVARAVDRVMRLAARPPVLAARLQVRPKVVSVFVMNL